MVTLSHRGDKACIRIESGRIKISQRCPAARRHEAATAAENAAGRRASCGRRRSPALPALAAHEPPRTLTPPLLLHHPVPDPDMRLNVAGMGGVLLDFLAKRSHENPERSHIRIQ